MTDMRSPSFATLAGRSAFQDDVGKYLSLDPTVRARVTALVAGGAGPEDLRPEVLSDIGIDAEPALRMASIAAVLLKAVRGENLSPRAVADMLASRAKDSAFAGLVESERETLVSLIAESPEERRDKASTSFLPTLVDFSATWDMRAVADESGRLVEYLPMLVMKIATETEYKYSELVVQLDEERFGQLRELFLQLDSSLTGVKDCCDRLRSEASPGLSE